MDGRFTPDEKYRSHVKIAEESKGRLDRAHLNVVGCEFRTLRIAPGTAQIAGTIYRQPGGHL